MTISYGEKHELISTATAEQDSGKELHRDMLESDYNE